jgi:RHS repeat-associated protein
VESYEYDENGNRTSFTGPSGTVTATYDDQDRLLTYGNASYTYTAAGELKQKVVGTDTTRYEYDPLGNLREVELPDGTLIEYLVDGQNRRVGKKVNGTFVQGFLYGDQLKPVAELDSTGNVVARFVYGSRINVPEYMIKGGSTYRIVSDHLGSVRLGVQVSNGNIAQQIDYETFGQVSQNTSSGFQSFGFLGGLADGHTAFVRRGIRDFDTQTGRWSTPDPALFSGSWANLYEYALGDPVNRFDLTGFKSCNCNDELVDLLLSGASDLLLARWLNVRLWKQNAQLLADHASAISKIAKANGSAGNWQGAGELARVTTGVQQKSQMYANDATFSLWAGGSLNMVQAVNDWANIPVRWGDIGKAVLKTIPGVGTVVEGIEWYQCMKGN